MVVHNKRKQMFFVQYDEETVSQQMKIAAFHFS